MASAVLRPSAVILTSPATGLADPMCTPSPTVAVMVGLLVAVTVTAVDDTAAAAPTVTFDVASALTVSARSCTVPALPMVTPSPIRAAMALLTEVVAFSQATVITPAGAAGVGAGGGLRRGRHHLTAPVAATSWCEAPVRVPS